MKKLKCCVCKNTPISNQKSGEMCNRYLYHQDNEHYFGTFCNGKIFEIEEDVIVGERAETQTQQTQQTQQEVEISRREYYGETSY